MADTKKEQERDELHRAIWAIADEENGTVLKKCSYRNHRPSKFEHKKITYHF